MSCIRRVLIVAAALVFWLSGCEKEPAPAPAGTGSATSATAGTSADRKGGAADTGARATGGVFNDSSADPATRPAKQPNR